MTVQLKPDAMQAAGIGINDIVSALGTQNLAAPVGRIDSPLTEESIRLKGRPEDAAAFRQVVVTQRSGALIHLGDVADVFEGNEELRTAASYNGHDAVGIEVKKSKGYSTTHVVDELKQEIARVQATLPGGARIDIVRDAGFRVTRAVDNVQAALIEGALLTVLVVFLFLNSWRSTVITGLALPVSVLASFIAVWAFGFTLNTMSLLGLSLAIGILIDDAIVVRENIVRHIEMGKDHFTASQEGTAEIGLAVTATTFSIVAVFVPIAFMSGRRRPVVQAVRADDRVRRAGVAVRVVLARPDAVGVLGRSAPAGRARRRGSPARSTGSTTGSTGRPTATGT